jgi:uncharacterized protein YoxC
MRRRTTSLVLAVGAALGGQLLTSPAAAQFVCVDGANSTQGSTATGNTNNMACGIHSAADGTNSYNAAVGLYSNAKGDSSSNTAVGFGNSSEGDVSANSSFGTGAEAYGDNSNNVSIGTLVFGSGDISSNTGLGYNVTSEGDNSTNTALGGNAVAKGNNSSNLAVGNGAYALGDGTHNIAVGQLAIAAGNSIAIGASANASFLNSAAFGDGAVVTRSGQQMFGNAGNTYTMAGIASADSKTAQGTPAGIVTSNASGDLAVHSASELGLASLSSVAAVDARVDGVEQDVADTNARVDGVEQDVAHTNARVDGVEQDVGEVKQDVAGIKTNLNAVGTHLSAIDSNLDTVNHSLAGVDSRFEGIEHHIESFASRLDGLDDKSDKALQGVAMAFAMAGTPALGPGETFAMSGNWGGYAGKSGVAFGAALKLGSGVQFDGGIAYGVSEGTLGGRAGMRVGW